MRISFCLPFVSLVACSSSSPIDSAGVAQKLGAAPVSALVGTWQVKDPSYPGGIKSEMDLAADGNFAVHDYSHSPAQTSSGAWGVAGSELELIHDSSDGTSYHRIAWTYLADASHLGIAVIATGATSGPVGTWEGHLVDQQVDGAGQPTSGSDTDATIVLGADATAMSHTVYTSVGAAAMVDDEPGTYTVASDGTLSLSLHNGNASLSERLVPCATGYANAIMIHP